jgi:hypothetical protein
LRFDLLDALHSTDSRIMPAAGGRFEHCYNARAAVTADSLLVIAAQVVQAPNDKQQIEPIPERIGALPADLDKPETLLADTGYFSEACKNLHSICRTMSDDGAHRGIMMIAPFAPTPSSPAPSGRR